MARINPFGRTVTIDVQVREANVVAGLIPLTITADEKLFVPVEELITLLGDAISPANAAALRSKAGAGGALAIQDGEANGIALTYDPGRVELRLELLQAGTRRSALSLVNRREYDVGEFLKPSGISGYATFRTSIDYVSKGQRTGLLKPIVDGLFAIRAAGIVVEDEHSADFNRATSRITRLGTRAIYDVAKWNVRFTGGDTDLAPTGFQQGFGILGLSASRLYRTFEPQRNIRPRSLDSFTLSRASDVEILVNGSPVRRIALAAGRYDLTDFPFVNGGNQVQVVAIDPTGRQEVANFSRYFDLNLLEPGLSEFNVAVGISALPGPSGPKYIKREPVASGFYRRGISNTLTLGFNAQADRHAQQAGAEFLYASPLGTIGVNAAMSNFKGAGFGGALRLDLQRNNDHAGPWQFSNINLGAEVHTKKFSAPGVQIFTPDPTKFRLSANASMRLPHERFLSFGGGYSESRLSRPTYNADVSYSFRLRRNVSVSIGANYQRIDTGRSGWGAFMNLSMRMGPKGFLTASVDSRDRRAQVSYSRIGSQQVGSLSGNLQADYVDKSMSLSGSGEFITNRADLGLAHTINYQPNGNKITGSRTSLRAATSIAFAGGHFSISRPIRDSFAIIVPHKTLKRNKIIIDPTPDGYAASSDFLGPPVSTELSNYSARAIRVDVPDAPAGYDFGTGSFLVRPPYRAGYLLRLGSDYMITAIGTLMDPEGKPLALAVGRAVCLDDPKAPQSEVFTNSAGRFGASGLKPGKWRITINGEQQLSYVFTVSDTTDLAQIGNLEPE